jgi:hypothetical protein
MGPYSSRPNEKLGFYLPVMIKKFAAAKCMKESYSRVCFDVIYQA